MLRNGMKRQIKKALSGFLVCGMILSQAVFQPPAVSADSSPNLKFGVISDVHLTDTSSSQNEENNLRSALTTFKNNGINVLVVCGDIANAGESGSYDKFNNVYNSVFTDSSTAPQKVIVMGNHDYWNGLLATLAQWRFTSKLGTSLNTSITVNGYHFIGVSPDNGDTNGTFGSSTQTWLQNQLNAAVADDPTKPIFVAVHQPVQNTVYGSDYWGNASLDSVLKNYPQVVLFAGHTHFPLEDERCIYQKDYTSVATATLSYTDLEGGRINGSVPPRAHEVAQGLLVSVDNSAVNIQRLDFHNNTTIKSDWVVDLPVNKADFRYTDARIAARQAPYFAAGSTLSFSDITENSCKVNLPSALDEDFVHTYRVQTIDSSTGGVVSDYKEFSDFYLGIPYMSGAQSFSTFGLSPNKTYEVRVWALESFGKSSPYLSGAFTTAAPDTSPNKDLLNVNFAYGNCKDNSQYNTPYTQNGSPSVATDSTLNKKVLNLNGSSFVNYKLTDEQLSKMSSRFTLETVFKMSSVKNQALVENLESSGIGFESDSNGVVNIWAKINGSYKTVGTTLTSGQYYYLTATYNGSEIDLYLNGRLVNSMTGVSGSVSMINTVPMCIGGNPDTAGKASLNFDGFIGLVRISSGVLTADQVDQRYKDYNGSGEEVLNINYGNQTGDKSSYHSACTLKGTAQTVYDSTIGQNVLALDGNGYANYTLNSTQLSEITNQFTLESVFKMNTIQQQAIIENTEQSGIGFESTSSGFTEVWVRIGSAYQKVGVQLSAGTYYYLAATYDGSKIKLYLNGSLVNSLSASGTVSYNSSVPMCVGGDPDTSGNAAIKFNGNIAYARLSSAAAGAVEIQNHYQKLLLSGADIINANYSTGSVIDSSAANTQSVAKGNPQIVFDSSINKNVLSLDGSSIINYNAAPSAIAQLNDQLTLEAVFHMNSIKDQTIIEDTEQSGIGFECLDDGKVEFVAYIGGAYKRVQVQLDTNGYYALTATYDGSMIRLYCNGALVDSAAATGLITYNSAVPFCVGGNPDTSGGAVTKFDGKIGMVRLGNKAISASEVQARYTQFFS